MPGPLDGISIVDVSAVISGPLATMILADQGARVVKVEPPGQGDMNRQAYNHRAGMSALFANCNRGKRSIAIDLKDPCGVELVRELVKSADVFVHNWRPGAAERLGLSESDLRSVNPDLIYASVSGYGPDGPYSAFPVYDPIVQGLSGHIAVQQNPDVPIRDLVRNVVADKSSAYTLAQAITAALFARDRGAGGQTVHVPMLDASLAFFWPDGMVKHTMVGDDVENPVALYEVYRLWQTADGHIVYFTATEKELRALYRALGHPEWVDDPRLTGPDRFLLENRELQGRLLVEAFAGLGTADLVERLSSESVAVGPVLTLEGVLEDRQVRHNDTVFEDSHPTYGRFRQARPAARFSGTPQQAGGPPPLLGEHTEAVLEELGYDAAARKKLKVDKTVA